MIPAEIMARAFAPNEWRPQPVQEAAPPHGWNTCDKPEHKDAYWKGDEPCPWCGFDKEKML